VKISKKQAAADIISELREQGHEAYFVGGCVRDLLMKKHPEDYDIATSAKPGEIKKCFKRTIPVGEAFGVIIVRMHNFSFEVAAFRHESGYSDGRHPEHVEFTNAKEDALRRDFTVNGLYYDPVTKKVMDWVKGQADIKRGVIRTIGSPERRFKEDKLRMLRAVRFATNLNFKIEKNTLDTIRKLHKKITIISRERIRDELIKLFTGPYPAIGLDWLDKTGLLKVVLPEIELLKGVKQPPQFHPEGDVYKHTRLMLSYLKRPTVVLAFSCLLHDIGKPDTFYNAKDRIRFNNHDKVGARMTDKLLTELKFSNDIKKQVVACVDGHMRFKDVRAMRESTLKKMFQRDTFLTELEQHKYDCMASHQDLSIWRFVRKKLKGMTQEEIKPDLYLKGSDLIKLGFKPGNFFVFKSL